MSTSRILPRAFRTLKPLRPSSTTYRPFSSSIRSLIDEQSEKQKSVPLNERGNDTLDTHRKTQMETPLNPHMTNTNSTIANDMPSVGVDSPPPEFISTVDGKFKPEDSTPENTDRMTGGTQEGGPNQGQGQGQEQKQSSQPSNSGGAIDPKTEGELGAGEIDGGQFRVEPLRRTGEDANTMRARLLYQSRKRGTLESDLLLSTFADANLGKMSPAQLQQYDRFLDENDWDLYYWVTQQPSQTSRETAEGSSPAYATQNAQGMTQPGNQPQLETDHWRKGQPRSGEWAQTVGAYKPAYRPVPARWKNSEILALLKQHVLERSAGGATLEMSEGVDGSDLSHTVKGVRGGGLGMMPEVKNFDV